MTIRIIRQISIIALSYCASFSTGIALASTIQEAPLQFSNGGESVVIHKLPSGAYQIKVEAEAQWMGEDIPVACFRTSASSPDSTQADRPNWNWNCRFESAPGGTIAVQPNGAFEMSGFQGAKILKQVILWMTPDGSYNLYYYFVGQNVDGSRATVSQSEMLTGLGFLE